MRSVPRMTQQLRCSRVQPASSNGLSGLNFGCLRHDCFQTCCLAGPARGHVVDLLRHEKKHRDDLITIFAIARSLNIEETQQNITKFRSMNQLVWFTLKHTWLVV